MKTKLEQVGVVGVDTGKLLISDPDYIDSLWQQGAPAPGHPPMALTVKGRKKFPAAPAVIGAFPFPWGKYDDPSPAYGGMSVNDMRDKGFAIEVPREPTGEFNYTGACMAVDSEPAGQLVGKNGVPLGVVTCTGYGDGVYPVYIRKNKDGRVAELVIKFLED